MLNHIPADLSPELVSTLMLMGHGDEITLGDANFPSSSLSERVVRADGLGVERLLESILYLFPLDHYNDWQVGLMSTVPGDPTPPIWQSYRSIIERFDPEAQIKHFERFAFYDHVRESSFAVVHTGETALYGNIILKKGVVEH